MITRAAVKIFDKRQNKEMVIPCHRHCDAFRILKEFGYQRFVDYEEIAQGFLDNGDIFLSRREAFLQAKACDQLLPQADTIDIACETLYSEDLW